MKGNKSAIAETIENKPEQDPQGASERPSFYEKMSALPEEIIELRKAKAIEYEEYLKRIAEIAKKVEAGHADDIPDASEEKSRDTGAL